MSNICGLYKGEEVYILVLIFTIFGAINGSRLFECIYRNCIICKNINVFFINVPMAIIYTFIELTTINLSNY